MSHKPVVDLASQETPAWANAREAALRGLYVEYLNFKKIALRRPGNCDWTGQGMGTCEVYACSSYVPRAYLLVLPIESVADDNVDRSTWLDCDEWLNIGMPSVMARVWFLE
jgi:hypothetical protein